MMNTKVFWNTRRQRKIAVVIILHLCHYIGGSMSASTPGTSSAAMSSTTDITTTNAATTSDSITTQGALTSSVGQTSTSSAGQTSSSSSAQTSSSSSAQTSSSSNSPSSSFSIISSSVSSVGPSSTMTSTLQSTSGSAMTSDSSHSSVSGSTVSIPSSSPTGQSSSLSSSTTSMSTVTTTIQTTTAGPISCYACYGNETDCGQRSSNDTNEMCSVGESCWTIATIVNTTESYNRTCSSQSCTFDYASYYCVNGQNSISECSKCCTTNNCNSDVYAPGSTASTRYLSTVLSLFVAILSVVKIKSM